MSGGMWLLWKNDIINPFSLQVIHLASRFIACRIVYLSSATSFVAVFVYAPAQLADKFDFWYEVVEYVNSLGEPFLISGDFNELSSMLDKQGGAPLLLSRLSQFQNILSGTNSIELAFYGHPFTWRWKRGGPDNTLERLNKATASPCWFSLFPNAKLYNHVFSSSDHCQVSLCLCNTSVKKAPPFRFEKMWCMRKDFDILIKKAWCSRFQGSHMFCLVKKLHLLKTKAKVWNSTKFENIFRQLKLLDNTLEQVQSQIILDPGSANLISKQERLLTKRRDLFSYQSHYWKQKSRDNFWLKGDTNSSYFHSCATIKKNRAMIKMFKASDGRLISIPVK